MRKIIQSLFMTVALVVGVGASSTAFADARTDARTHYQSGVQLYNSADYRGAIREFSAAQQLAPADLNNYNLALCYDKLGDAEPAVQYYRAYLDKQPTTDKKAEIEASINRLDTAAKSAAAKRADEARKIEDARRAEEARAAAEAKKADDARQALAAEEARKRAEDDARRNAGTNPTGPVGPSVGPVGPGPTVGTGPSKGPDPIVGPSAPRGNGSTGTPGAGTVVSTGDRQLDRASSIDINSIRDQRVGAGASGMPDDRGGRAQNPQNPRDGSNGKRVAQAGGPEDNPPVAKGGVQPTQTPGGSDDPNQKKVEPVYKKWWFWAVVAVSAYVVYSIATENSSQTGGTVRGRELPPMPMGSLGAQPGGLTLMHF